MDPWGLEGTGSNVPELGSKMGHGEMAAVLDCSCFFYGRCVSDDWQMCLQAQKLHGVLI